MGLVRLTVSFTTVKMLTHLAREHSQLPPARRAGSPRHKGKRHTMSESNRRARRTRVHLAAVAGVILTAGVAAISLTTAASAASGCEVAYATNTWSGGFTANIA